MKILTSADIKGADKYTILHEAISSLDLMERASAAIAAYICGNYPGERPLLFVAGKGNNGGDALAVARMLAEKGRKCSVCLLFDSGETSPEYRENLSKLPKNVERVSFPFNADKDTLIVDAILGTGFSGDIRGIAEEAVDAINSSGCEVLSIDIPSGMAPEFGNSGKAMVKASTTPTLQFPKLAMLLPEAGNNAGRVVVLDIGISDEFIKNRPSPYYYTTREDITPSPVREKFSHKGSYGHSLLVCGSSSMAGAAVLAARGALRSGCGLVTVHTPSALSGALFSAVPAAMVSADEGPCFSNPPHDTARFSALGIGCGLGTSPQSAEALRELMGDYRRPMVIDADALNIISSDPSLQKLIPAGSILTPHPGELKRLVGEWEGEDDKLGRALNFARDKSCYIVIKGAHTAVVTPCGKVRFNSTGSPSMAKGGSGDVLTGLITGLLARGLFPEEAAVKGVFYHGIAGEKAANKYGDESVNSSDIADFIRIL